MACTSSSTCSLARGAYRHIVTPYCNRESKVSGGLWVGTGESSHQGPGIIKDIDVPCTSKSTCSLADGTDDQTITAYGNGPAKASGGLCVGTGESSDQGARITGDIDVPCKGKSGYSLRWRAYDQPSTAYRN